jgi:hypothetical protein
LRFARSTRASNGDTRNRQAGKFDVATAVKEAGPLGERTLRTPYEVGQLE